MVDNFERGVVNVTVFVDITAAYDTINRILLINNICKMTADVKFIELIGDMIYNKRTSLN